MLEKLRDLLIDAGASAAGIAEACAVEEETRLFFKKWLQRGMHAGMSFMENNMDVRFDPRLLLEGAKTIVSVAFNYRQPNPLAGKVATYALGLDYHKVLRNRLEGVADELKSAAGGDYRICIDSAPILERYWAEKAGVGSRSPHHGNIVVPGVGSMVFLAEIVATLEFDPADYGKRLFPSVALTESDSAGVRKYPCPTSALGPNGVIDSRKCINYLTIEHHADWSEDEKLLMSRSGACGSVFGCDLCQLSDPENHTAMPEILPEFRFNEILPEFLSSLKVEIDSDVPAKPLEGFSLRRSPLGRAGRRVLRRNIMPR